MSAMNCQEISRNLFAYADGELDALESLEVLEHVRECTTCSQRVYAEQKLKASIARTMGQLKAPSSLVASVQAMLEAEAAAENDRQESAAAIRRPPLIYRIHWPAVIAACLALAVVAYWQLGAPFGQPTGMVTATLPPSDTSDKAVAVARSFYKVHMHGGVPDHHGAGLPKDAAGAAAALSAQLNLKVLQGGSDLRLATFESANACTLYDRNQKPHKVAHLVFRSDPMHVFSLITAPEMPDVAELKTMRIGSNDYALLVPAASTQCHPVTILSWNDNGATYAICAPLSTDDARDVAEPIRLALESSPQLRATLLAMIGQ